MDKKFSDLLPRIISAVVGVVVILFSITWGQWGFFLVFLVISSLTIWEFYGLLKSQKYIPLKILGVIIGILIFSLFFLIAQEILSVEYYIILFPISSLAFFWKLYKKNDKKPFLNVGLFYLGLIYIAFPFAMINYIVFDGATYSYAILLGILLLTWSNDAGAYFFGILFGKTKLFHRISPKKSWEGFLGGVSLSVLVAVFLTIALPSDLKWIDWIIVSLITVIVGTYGDLVESLFKRSMNIKDSGVLIPGHGGFLDRFDGLLLAIPFIVIFLKFFKSSLF